MRHLPACTFGTRPTKAYELYDFRVGPLEALTGSPEDYVVFGYSGHGINSYRLTYNLVDGPLAVFAQLPWGGYYMDKQGMTAVANTLFDHLARLLLAAEAAKKTWLGARPGRLVVIDTLRGRREAWGWLDAPLSDAQVGEWYRPRETRGLGPIFTSIRAAARWLEAPGEVWPVGCQPVHRAP